MCDNKIDFKKSIDYNSNAFLHNAAKSIHGRMVEMVINYSSVLPDVNSKNFIGVTPLHVAALNNTEPTAMLLKYNADINITTSLGYTPLQYAAKHGCYIACRVLWILERTSLKCRPVYFINEELNFNWQNCYKQTALHQVIDARDGAIMRSKKKWPFNICEDRYTRIVKILLKMGANPNIKNYAGNIRLHIAGGYEMEYIVKLLLHCNANIHVRNNRDETPMNLAKTNSYPHTKNLIRVN